MTDKWDLFIEDGRVYAFRDGEDYLQTMGETEIEAILNAHDELKTIEESCRGLQSVLSLPWQKGHVTNEERAILTALEKYDDLLTGGKP